VCIAIVYEIASTDWPARSSDIKLPLLSDKSHHISRDYGVLLEDEGVALRGLFLIDPKGILRQITIKCVFPSLLPLC
jgi:alkyl hydroperoxide reductase subunit AhpC